MTLVFLGYHPEKEIDRIAEAALGVDAPAPEIRLEPEPVGVPRGKHARACSRSMRPPRARSSSSGRSRSGWWRRASTSPRSGPSGPT